MTELLERAMKIARDLSDEKQDDAARYIISLAGGDDDGGVYQFKPGEWELLQEGLRQADRGEFATDEEMQALWAKYGA